MFCPNCGKQVENDAKFCEFCGSILKKEQPPQPMMQQSSTQQPPQPMMQQSSTQQPSQPMMQQSSTQQPPQNTPKKKSAAPLIIGLVITFLVIAIAAVVLIIVFAKKDNKKSDKDNKATEVITEYTNNSETKEPNTENITTEIVTTEPLTEDKISSEDNTTENNYSDDDAFFDTPMTWQEITDGDVTFYIPGEYMENGDNDNVYTISDNQGYSNSYSYTVNENTVSEKYMREEFKKAIESTYGTGYDMKTIVINGRKWEIYEFQNDDYVENYCAVACLFVDEDKLVYMEELTRLDSNSYIKNIIKTVDIK